MGKGDKRTRRGKIYRGSHGKTRSHKGRHGTPAASTTTKSAGRKASRR